MDAAEFEVSGQAYRSGKLDAFKQSHIVRRLAPVLGSIGQLRKYVVMDGSGNVASADLPGVLSVVSEALSKLSDDDVEYIQKTCLAVVSRKQGDLFSSVLPRGGVLAFEDIGMLEMNTIVFYVLKDNLAGFFSGIGRKVSPVPQSG